MSLEDDKPSNNTLPTKITGGGSTPTTANVAMPSADTEYSYTLPVGTKQYEIQLRDANSMKLLVGDVDDAGDSGTTFITVPSDSMHYEQGIDTHAGVILYFQSPAASQIAEIVTWT
ncbi:MAG: hypothetical protein V3U02_04545 [Calditrichia bacterium]